MACFYGCGGFGGDLDHKQCNSQAQSTVSVVGLFLSFTNAHYSVGTGKLTLLRLLCVLLSLRKDHIIVCTFGVAQSFLVLLFPRKHHTITCPSGARQIIFESSEISRAPRACSEALRICCTRLTAG